MMDKIAGIFTLQDKAGRTFIFSDQLEFASSLMTFMQEAIYGRKRYSELTVDSLGRKRSTVTSLGKHLGRLSDYAHLFSRKYTFHPAMRFFFEEYRNHEITYCSGYGGNDRDGHGRLVCNIFDDFVAVMRNKSVKTKLKKQISDWESKINKNKKRAFELEYKLFERRSRLTVVRLDLEYRAALFEAEELENLTREAVLEKKEDQRWYWDGGDIEPPKIGELRVAFDVVQSDRLRLFANMKGKPSLFEDLCGYIWRIECSPRAGYHIHLALFFDGSHLLKHEWRAQKIGEYWVDSITSGRGRFHNCNMHWDKNSPLYALGEIESYDHAKRAKLRKSVLSYLAKESQPVLILPYPGCHLYGSGFAHRDRSKGRGRPRKQREGRPQTRSPSPEQ